MHHLLALVHLRPRLPHSVQREVVWRWLRRCGRNGGELDARCDAVSVRRSAKQRRELLGVARDAANADRLAGELERLRHVAIDEVRRRPADLVVPRLLAPREDATGAGEGAGEVLATRHLLAAVALRGQLVHHGGQRAIGIVAQAQLSLLVLAPRVHLALLRDRSHVRHAHGELHHSHARQRPHHGGVHSGVRVPSAQRAMHVPAPRVQVAAVGERNSKVCAKVQACHAIATAQRDAHGRVDHRTPVAPHEHGLVLLFCRTCCESLGGGCAPGGLHGARSADADAPRACLGRHLGKTAAHR
mmetsp:Transcript_8982/g.28377  ORF Transcript_8982/g.28377 Transcript_8982/m.28377 type:complete len:301 (+) Transcript_8982:1032-1934(+)